MNNGDITAPRFTLPTAAAGSTSAPIAMVEGAESSLEKNKIDLEPDKQPAFLEMI